MPVCRCDSLCVGLIDLSMGMALLCGGVIGLLLGLIEWCEIDLRSSVIGLYVKMTGPCGEVCDLLSCVGVFCTCASVYLFLMRVCDLSVDLMDLCVYVWYMYRIRSRKRGGGGGVETTKI